MNDGELNRILRSAPLPQRPAGYWEWFPDKVVLALRHRPERAKTTGRSFLGFVMLGLAAACLAFGLFVQVSGWGTRTGAGAELATARKFFAETEALFPHQVQAIVFDSQGPHLLLAAKPDVALTAPLFLRLCTKKVCEEVVTFSGQEISFSGQTCQVLAEANGQVLVVGDHTVWAQKQGPDAVSVAAEPLLPASTL